MCHCKAQEENESTGISILGPWREEIPDEHVHPHNMTDSTNDNDTTNDYSSYHSEDDADSLPAMNKLETESVGPIQAVPDELEPIGVEVVNENLQIEGVDYDNKTIITEPEVTHAHDDDLFVLVEPPANVVITPCLSQAMIKFEIDGVNNPPPPPPPPPHPHTGSMYPEWEGLIYSGKPACHTRWNTTSPLRCGHDTISCTKRFKGVWRDWC